MEHKVKVHIKSLPYQPRGKAGEYRAGSVQIIDRDEAYELEKAGIAMIVEDPYFVPAEPSLPYLSEEVPAVEPQKDEKPSAEEVYAEKELEQLEDATQEKSE